MRTSERRFSPRFKLRTPMAFHRMGALFAGEFLGSLHQHFDGRNILCHASALVGWRTHRANTRSPKTGQRAADSEVSPLIGRVARVVSNLPEGFLGIGVQLICYETPPTEPRLAEAA